MRNMLLKCTNCNTIYNFDINKELCEKCGNGLSIEMYNLNFFKPLKNEIGIWKYANILPYVDEKFRYSLGEANTNLHKSIWIKKDLKIDEIWFKDETTEPTGSYLDRSSALFISMISSLGYKNIITYSTGNLGASLSAYSSKAGLKMQVYIRPGIDLGKLYQMIAYGAEVNIIKNFKEEIIEKEDTAIAIEYNPIINEAKKTIMLEIFFQLNQDLPDYIILPMGEGGLLYSTFKMLIEIRSLIKSKINKMKIIGVQPEGCAPIVKAFEKGLDSIEMEHESRTKIFDLSVMNPKFGNAALKAIRETNGYAISVSDNEIFNATMILAKKEGILAEPAASLTLAGLIKLRKIGEIERDSRIVCVITGSGLKDPKIMKEIALKESKLGSLIEELSGKIQLGNTKIAILKLLSEKEMYGYQIWKELKEKYNLNIKIPTIYQHLSELIEKGYVKKVMSKHIFGRKREYYSLTEKGKNIV
ncbi:MAG: pyridoxal-phosphate dependent enzyme [Nitrososphaerota archaeon]